MQILSRRLFLNGWALLVWLFLLCSCSNGSLSSFLLQFKELFFDFIKFLLLLTQIFIPCPVNFSQLLNQIWVLVWQETVIIALVYPSITLRVEENSTGKICNERPCSWFLASFLSINCCILFETFWLFDLFDILEVYGLICILIDDPIPSPIIFSLSRSCASLFSKIEAFNCQKDHFASDTTLLFILHNLA